MTNNASSAQPMFQVRCNTAAAFSAEGRHNAKVQALLADEIFSNRLLFGRNNAQQPLSDHEIACNTAATRLLCENYRLVRWDGASIRTGDLLNAARQAVARQRRKSSWRLTRAWGTSVEIASRRWSLGKIRDKITASGFACNKSSRI